MTTHLPDPEIRRWAEGRLEPRELLAADDHLAECAACRSRAAALTDAGDRAGRATDDLPLAAHLTDDEVTRLVDGSLPPEAAARATAHARGCGVCAEQVRDLRAWAAPTAVPFASRRVPTRAAHAPYAAAAAVLLAVVLPFVSWILWTRAINPRAVPGLAELAPAAQHRVRAALDAGGAEPPTWLEDLAGSREVLMGGTVPAAGFAPLAPVATAVVDDRPLLQWQPLEGATSYTVEVFDESLRAVASSPPLTATEWLADRALPRDRTYEWQVTARRGAESVIAPRSPAPAARFRVVDAETAALVGRVRAAHPDSHLLLGILYLQAGVRAEARRHLESVPPSDRYAAVARRSLEHLTRTAP